MNDRELLELAAKAAGYTHIVGFDHNGLHIGRIGACWNPLESDAEALQLACDLGLRVFPVARTQSGAACSAVGSVTSERLSEVADMSLDTRSATRRAIVLAAAEIGRAKP